MGHIVPISGKVEQVPQFLQAFSEEKQTPFQASMWSYVRFLVLFAEAFASTCPLYESSGFWAAAGQHAMWNALSGSPLIKRGFKLAGRLAKARTASMALCTAADLALVWTLLTLSCTGAANALEPK